MRISTFFLKISDSAHKRNYSGGPKTETGVQEKKISIIGPWVQTSYGLWTGVPNAEGVQSPSDTSKAICGSKYQHSNNTSNLVKVRYENYIIIMN